MTFINPFTPLALRLPRGRNCGRLLAAQLLGLWLLTGCSSKPSAEDAATSAPRTEQAALSASDEPLRDERDPFESFNRSMWTLNQDYLDAYILRPATIGYVTVVPKPLRNGFANIVNNLNEPANALNALLQWKPAEAGKATGRFLLNSTLGIAGLIDVATAYGVSPVDEDFNQTLAVWGVADGPFLMIPARGPSTVRNMTGDVVDNLYFPMTLLTGSQNVGKFVIGALTAREQLLDTERLLNQSADSYLFVRDAYFQRKQYQIYDGEPPQEETVDEEALEQFMP
jgi:phospholipid-binding lipoprotein MlaA